MEFYGVTVKDILIPIGIIIDLIVIYIKFWIYTLKVIIVKM
jgi:hypothetical protein